jgi:hypothetical protein
MILLLFMILAVAVMYRLLRCTLERPGITELICFNPAKRLFVEIH